MAFSDPRQRDTKARLVNALIELLSEKPLIDISVADICESSGVSRKTFYRYYANHYALFEAIQDDLFDAYRMRGSIRQNSMYQIVTAIMHWVDDNRVLALALLDNVGVGGFIDRLCNDLYEAHRETWEDIYCEAEPHDVEALFYYVISGVIGLVRRWLLRHPDVPCDRIVAEAHALMMLSEPRRDNSLLKPVFFN